MENRILKHSKQLRKLWLYLMKSKKLRKVWCATNYFTRKCCRKRETRYERILKNLLSSPQGLHISEKGKTYLECMIEENEIDYSLFLYLKDYFWKEYEFFIFCKNSPEQSFKLVIL